MNGSSGPPSYVPTLTQVVHLADEVPSKSLSCLTQPAGSDQSVLTAVTELVQAANPATPTLAPGTADSDAVQELLVARVLEQVDLMLETRLHEVLAPLIHAHLQELLPRLQEEIELTVRQAVTQAFEYESLSSPPS